jgi:hypothetical protein
MLTIEEFGASLVCSCEFVKAMSAEKRRAMFDAGRSIGVKERLPADMLLMTRAALVCCLKKSR